MTTMNLFDLSGQTAIITGGGRGLGEWMAEALTDAGANVVLCSRKKEACIDVRDRINENGGNAIAFRCDVTDENEVQQVVDATMEHFGTIDILVNNSGTSWGGYNPEDMPVDKFKKVVNVNLVGTFIMSQAVGKKMIENGTKGRIINIASVAGLKGSNPEVMQAIGYNSSKGGVLTFTKDLAINWARHGITVNAVAPGFIPTKMSQDVIAPIKDQMIANVPLQRLGEADDMRGTIVYMASQAAAFMTGQTIVLDGGVTAG
ncbi:SDR family oxidoreductase [Salicibibacter kimchii]|uniref:SDR family NAD(P)-dependent oxidoreductase n=1 Tax=Salicibibacter kimchii TaxID=2099786 RepID=A0A345BWQ6_9BACI|nr:SDR family oxidoreductase [Salicibibacter kimchii]AXF55387.1 SDR family NAD(P)-dependent oxidoreductase [Salicibibacter kimchii]